MTHYLLKVFIFGQPIGLAIDLVEVSLREIKLRPIPVLQDPNLVLLLVHHMTYDLYVSRHASDELCSWHLARRAGWQITFAPVPQFACVLFVINTSISTFGWKTNPRPCSLRNCFVPLCCGELADSTSDGRLVLAPRGIPAATRQTKEHFRSHTVG